MDFRIADTFTDSLSRLTGDEQKAVKTTAFDLQLNPANPGMSFHKLDKAKDKNFWSVRVNSDIRLIVHRSAGNLLLCFVGHHDKAYDWAERRKLETHPTTGAAQLVELRQTVKEILIPAYVQAEAAGAPKPVGEPTLLFAGISDDELLAYGVPTEWLRDVKNATEDTLLAIAEHLPAEAAEALLELATGGKPHAEIVDVPLGATLRYSSAIDAHPAPSSFAEAPQAGFREPTSALRAESFSHPDAQRRFRTITSIDELQRALDFPWDKWTVFLHPDQRDMVERDYAGPARVSGSAGTGKTIVALHRVAHLARTHPNSRVLLTTFSDTLANALLTKLKRLLGNEPRLAERIDVHSLNAIGLRLYKAHVGPASIADAKTVSELIREAASAVGGHKFGQHFLRTEWEQVVDAWQLGGWEAYRDVARLGRKTRLPEPQRKVLWSIFEGVSAGLRSRGLITHAELFTSLAAALSKSNKIVFDFAVVDEAQDITPAHLRFLAALGSGRPNSLFFAGDLGQRIFQQPFSWKALGVDIRGRSRTLRVNYRTSHQIRLQADRLLGPVVTDVDGNKENRSDTVSVFNGPVPTVSSLQRRGGGDQDSRKLAARTCKGRGPAHELGIFVRSEGQLERARAAAQEAQMAFKLLDEKVETTTSYLSIGTMHLAKGLEFRAVAVMACDDEVIPWQERIETVGDDADLQEVYDTERHLLYVACTRARDHLLVTGVAPVSEFLDDFVRP
jgi:superfamily I DNA/RNA helicase/mRNA-degrading endonuclease RelE of RelBE toxin-antitoxin system